MEDLAALETDVLAGFVLARSAAELSDGTIASDVMHLEQVRAWFGRPLWEMQPPDADIDFGKVLRDIAKGTRLSRAQAIKTYFPVLPVNCTSSGSSIGHGAWSVERVRRGPGCTACVGGGTGSVPSAGAVVAGESVQLPFLVVDGCGSGAAAGAASYPGQSLG